MVFLPDVAANHTLATNGNNGRSTYTISDTNYIGLTFNGQTLTISNGVVTGNAATSGLLSTLNSYLGSLPSFSISDLTVDETIGVAKVVVQLSSISSNNVSYDYETLDSTALAGSDYQWYSGTRSIPAGSLYDTIHIPIVDDLFFELSEYFKVFLSNSTNASILDPHSIITIADNDRINALPDSYQVDGSTGGITNSILLNDSLNGTVVNIADVTISSISIPSGWSINNGQIVVPSNTPAGNYITIYQICDNVNLNSCDTALVSILVTVPSSSTNTTCNPNSPYDKIVSGYHQSIALKSDGTYSIWGQQIASNGSSDVLEPAELGNFPIFANKTILKATIGGQGGSSKEQIVALADDGLYAWGTQGFVLHSSLTSSTAAAKISTPTNGDATTKLPTGVAPSDVKHLMASYQTLGLVTNSGSVYILSQSSKEATGSGTGSLSSTTWYQVNTAPNTPLTGVTAMRFQVSNASYNAFLALKSDGTLYTWGNTTYLGDGSAATSKAYATSVTLPGTLTGGISIIGVSGGTKKSSTTKNSLYILDQSGKLYSLGANNHRQLGDFTTTERTSWTTVKSAAGTDFTNVEFFTVQEHDASFPCGALITDNGHIYTWGLNDYNMLGRPVDGNTYDPGIPGGFDPVNEIAISAEMGGHTLVFLKEGTSQFCYVGHKTNGSMGDGTSASGSEATANCAGTPSLDVCGSVPVAGDTITSTISANPSSITADGTSTSTITVQLKDVLGVNLTTTGGIVAISTNLGTVGSTTDNNDGTYTSILTSNLIGGTATLRYTLNGHSGVDTAYVNFIPSIADINAVNDSVSISGFNGGSSQYILNNDSLNSSLIDSADVNITANSLPHGWSLTAGKVIIPAGTAAGNYQVVYKLCEVHHINNCDTAIVYVTVTSPAIKAVPDVFTVNGYNGGSSLYILNNDSLNGVLIDSADVNITPTSLPSGWNLTNGQVIVPANTPAGNYSVIYQICEVINPSNCDTAVVTVNITAPNIHAVRDNYQINGISGGTTGFVLSNDSLNGAVIDSADVNITHTSLPSGWNLTNGQVIVPASTPAGNYSVIYQICEVINPSNCDTALVTVSVTAPAINAGPNTYNVNGFTGGTVGSIFTNDSLNGAPLDTNDVNITINNLPNGWSYGGGSITVPAGTPAGPYTITYVICDVVNPNNCDTATITVNIAAPAINAVHDVFTVNGYNGGSSQYILNNDSLNGVLIDSADVNITPTSLPSGWNLTNGQVIVPAGTPAGNYSVIYQICEVINPSNCDTALVTVSVTAPAIYAGPNTYNVNGFTGGTVGSIFTNDSLNGAPLDTNDVNITINNLPNGWSYGGGSITVPAGTPAGPYTITYVICDVVNPNNCDTATITVNITAPAINAVHDVFTVNGYNGGSSQYILNNDSLNGVLIDSADVNITPTSLPTGWNLTNGQVIVPTGTPAGNYSVIYQICEVINPSNCDTALVTVSVTAPAMNLTNDTIVFNGFYGYPAGIDILANDLINGTSASGQQVQLVNPIITNASLNTNGLFTLNPTVNAGFYTFMYTVTDTLNPTNIDTAYIHAESYAIGPIALDDADTTIENTAVTHDVLNNDTDMDGNLNPASITIVQQGVHSAAIINSLNQIQVTPNSNWFGIDTVVYAVCDSGISPSLCDTALFVVYVFEELKINLVQSSNILCFGDASGEIALNITGGLQPYSISWSHDPNNDSTSATLLNAGTYQIIVADAYQQIDTLTITLTQPTSALTFSANVESPLCFGDANASITVNILGGTAPYSILWNTTDTNSTLNQLGSGVYSFTITDANGCQITDSIEVIDPSAIELLYADIVGVECISDPSGSITVTVIGGTGSLKFNWSNGQTGPSLIHVAGGSYELTITDENSCSTVLNLAVPFQTDNCESLLNIPNGISPNNDNLNDNWVIEGIEYFPHNKLQIFNRWGGLVFEKDGYQNDFNGHSNQGLRIESDGAIPAGTYFYFLSLYPGAKPISGYLFIAR